MKLVRAVLLLATAMTASAADISGTWKAVFTCRPEQQPKTFSEIIFHLNVEGGKLTGTAHMGSWPGDAPLVDGKIEADHVSFTATGKFPWRSQSSLGEASGLPRLTFDAVFQGAAGHLTLYWDSVMLYGDQPPGREYNMKLMRISGY